ncbi:ribbon-helix-helix domain-containing protein [Methylibium petroleiphilum]|uniref:ribbon-helix-helix domain-containing protein n=1 Tax=Methylibium petroleiphilum TaxID=105560 RepID=UPI003D2735B5
MCKLYVQADPLQYEPRQRSVRIHGVITSIRLENLMWRVLSDIASEQKCTTNALITKLYDEATTHRSESANFASFLRVTCVRHLIDSGRLGRERDRVRREAEDETWDIEESQAVFAH